MKHLLTPLLLGLALAACSSDEKKTASTTTTSTTTTTTPPPAESTPAPAAPKADSVAPAPTGFDPASAPVSSASLPGAWPYFGLLDGYVRVTDKTDPGDDPARTYSKDVAFDRYAFFDGGKLVPVEGRRVTMKAKGKGASFFQVQKNYEKLVKDLGGVTVFEGTGQTLADHKLKFAEGTHRARYWLEKDEMGVYFLRTPDKEIWVEAYKPYPLDNEDYWLTVVEKKALDVTARLLPAEELKKELDAKGHVALYINFDTDKATIKPESLPVVTEVVKLLAANPPLKLSVEGHTDNAGTPDHNQALSEARAKSVVAALTGLGIGTDRLQAKGFGQTRPLADNATEVGRAKNRRVELVKL